MLASFLLTLEVSGHYGSGSWKSKCRTQLTTDNDEEERE